MKIFPILFRGDEPDFGVVSIPKFMDSDTIDETDAQRITSNPRFQLTYFQFYPTYYLATLLSRDAMFQNIREPTWEDILVAYATIPGFVANRNRYRGTWFIELICKVRVFVNGSQI